MQYKILHHSLDGKEICYTHMQKVESAYYWFIHCLTKPTTHRRRTKKPFAFTEKPPTGIAERGKTKKEVKHNQNIPWPANRCGINRRHKVSGLRETGQAENLPFVVNRYYSRCIDKIANQDKKGIETNCVSLTANYRIDPIIPGYSALRHYQTDNPRRITSPTAAASSDD